jgi:hypothetical protein
MMHRNTRLHRFDIRRNIRNLQFLRISLKYRLLIEILLGNSYTKTIFFKLKVLEYKYVFNE